MFTIPIFSTADHEIPLKKEMLQLLRKINLFGVKSYGNI